MFTWVIMGVVSREVTVWIQMGFSYVHINPVEIGEWIWSYQRSIYMKTEVLFENSVGEKGDVELDPVRKVYLSRDSAWLQLGCYFKTLCDSVRTWSLEVFIGAVESGRRNIVSHLLATSQITKGDVIEDWGFLFKQVGKPAKWEMLLFACSLCDLYWLIKPEKVRLSLSFHQHSTVLQKEGINIFLPFYHSGVGLILALQNLFLITWMTTVVCSLVSSLNIHSCPCCQSPLWMRSNYSQISRWHLHSPLCLPKLPLKRQRKYVVQTNPS